MPSLDIPPPANWEDFEDLCLDLWRLIWADPKARKHGRRGQPQAGVDVYGQPKVGAGWEGVQCKLKSQILDKKLTREEIQDEVSNARTFEPALAAFTLATTASRDTDVEAAVRKISSAQRAADSFRVSVAFWEDILEEIERLEGSDPELLIRHLRAWRRRERGAGPGPGSLTGVPKLPPHYLERPGYLEPLKRAVLHQVADKLGITGTGTVGVQGMGGIGKTVLAAAVAREEEVRGAFADGILWVTVGRLPDLVALQVELAAAAGHPEPVFGSVPQGKRELEQIFAGRQTLIVADDVWTADAASAFDVIGASGRLLITTRNTDVITGLGAKEHRLDVLEPEQALAFLADWSGQDAGELPELAARVARACGYLPLALAMIGAMVQHRPTGWGDALTRLEGADLDKFRRDFPDYPYPDLLRALEASVTVLEPEDRERYLELAVFREDETIPEAALTTLWSEAGLDGIDTRDLIHRLAARSLASVVDNDGLKLHDLQRDYVRKRAAGNLTVLHQRLLNAYARCCDDGWPSGPDDGYYFQRLPYHLVQARRSGELGALLLEMRWLQAKLKAAGVAPLIADYNLLPLSQDLRRVQRALQLAAHILIHHPQQLAGQLLGRLQPDSEAPEIDSLLEGARGTGAAPPGSLQPRAPTLQGPGGSLVGTLEGHRSTIKAVAALSDDRVISAGRDTLRVWDVATWAAAMTFDVHGPEVRALATFSDGRVVSASEDSTLQIWDLEARAVVATLYSQGGAVRALATLSDGRVVSAGDGDTLRDIVSGAAVATLQGHGGEICALGAFSDARVVTGSRDGSLRVWDLESGAAIATLEGRGYHVRALAVMGDGRVTWSSDDFSLLRSWDPKSDVVVVHECYIGAVRALATLENHLVVSGSADGRLRVWELEPGDATLQDYRGQTWPPEARGMFRGVWALATLADRFVVSGSVDGRLRIWDFKSGTLVATHEGHRGVQTIKEGLYRKVTALASITDWLVVTGSMDGCLRVWDLESGALIATLESKAGRVWVVRTLTDGRVISGSSDGSLRVWDLKSGALVATMRGHGDVVSALAALDHDRVVSGSWDGLLRLWDLKSSTVIATQEVHPEGEGRGWVTALAVSNGRIVSGSDDGMLRLWDPEAGSEVATLGAHSAMVTALVALTDGRVVSGSEDRTLRVWDMRSGRQLAVFTLEAAVIVLAVSSSGVVIAGDTSGQVHFFDLPK